jgi:putative ABC transport system permease protein
MLSSYLKLSLRNLLKNPLFTTLNVCGLALGLAVSLLLFLHVKQEWSFDKYHSKAPQIHRVILNAFWDSSEPEMIANAPNVVGPAMKEAIPAVEQYARLLHHGFGESAFITAGANKFVEERLFWADPGIFEIFDIPALAGDLSSALVAPNTVALSRSTAVRYFGTSNPIGQSIKVDQMPPLEVKAVFEDFPGNSSLNPHVLGSFKTMKWANDRLVWSNASFETWLLLNPDANPKQVEQQLTALLDKNVKKANQWFSMWLQPLKDVHFYSSEMSNNYCDRLGDPKQVGILGALALAIFLIACFNYMNLSTARSQLRFREVGINKTMGASRQQLALRFYAETGILALFSLFLAGGLLVLGIPLFNQLADKQLSTSLLLQPSTLAAVLGIGALVVLLAGSYPAFFLSAYQPKNLLQTSFRKSSGAGLFRRSLVTAQFSASIVLIIGTLVLYKQMQFIQQKKLGFEPHQVVAITTIAAENATQIDALMQGCQALSTVSGVCRAQTFPGKEASVRTLSLSSNSENGTELLSNRVTSGFEKVLGINLLAGTTLPQKSPTDTIVHVLLNKTAVDFLGSTPDDIIGKKVECNLGDNAYVCGVTEDFNAKSLHKAVGAYAFHDAKTEDRRFLLVKMNTTNLPETMRQIEHVFQQSLPQSAFEYTFLDEHMQSLYSSEQRTAKVVLVFSFLSILISCLGLFGLAAFAAEQRMKEIGVRKVLGASVVGITGLLAKDFMKLVLVAILIASPIAYYFMDAWLADFVYRVEVSWWVFVLAGAVAMALAFATVSFQSIRAALANPVKSLRSE